MVQFQATPIFVRICPVWVFQFSVARAVEGGTMVAVGLFACFTHSTRSASGGYLTSLLAVDLRGSCARFENRAALLVGGRRNFVFRMGEAASGGKRSQSGLLDRSVGGSITAEFIEAGNELHC